METEQVSDTIGMIYDVALDQSAWPPLLAQLSAMFNCHFVDSFRRADDYSWFNGTVHGLEQTDYEEIFLGDWARRNVWGQRRPVRRAGDVLVTREITPADELLRSEMYNEYLAPRGLHEGLRMDIWAGQGWIEDISMLRPWSAGQFSPGEITMAHRLLAHLRRATAVGRRLDEAEQIAIAGVSALEHLQSAMLLLSRQGRIVYANASAQALLANSDGVVATPAGLGCTCPNLAGALQAALDGACDRFGFGGRSAALRIPRSSGEPALALTALPLRAETQPFQTGGRDGPAALVCITDPRVGVGTQQGQLASLFGLTQAEAAVAGELLAGFELREIAERSGRSFNTVRTHLARLLAKTDTRRQSDLVRLLARLPLA